VPPDISEVDDALVTRLLGDSELAALLPDGVYFGLAPNGVRRFCIVSLVQSLRQPTFDGGIEEILYAVKAVAQVSGGPDPVKAAAARIDALLDNQSLTVTGFDFVAMYRDDTEGRIRYTEIDDMDKSIRWQHRGGRYRVQVTLPAPALRETS